MKIANDINGINNARMLQTSQNAQKKSMEKLASGNKINRSADDAAGLSISEKMLKQIQGINKAIDNASDGMSMVNTADGAMDEMGGMLQRLNDLAMKGSNGTLSADERSAINEEAGQLLGVDLAAERLDAGGDGGARFEDARILHPAGLRDERSAVREPESKAPVRLLQNVPAADARRRRGGPRSRCGGRRPRGRRPAAPRRSPRPRRATPPPRGAR